MNQWREISVAKYTHSETGHHDITLTTDGKDYKVIYRRRHEGRYYYRIDTFEEDKGEVWRMAAHMIEIGLNVLEGANKFDHKNFWLEDKQEGVQ